jgi:hypothetical protein
MTPPPPAPVPPAPILPPRLAARPVVAPTAQLVRAVIPPSLPLPSPVLATAPAVAAVIAAPAPTFVAPVPRTPIVTAAAASTTTTTAAPRPAPRPFEPPLLPPPRNPPAERPVAFERPAPPAAAIRGPERGTLQTQSEAPVAAAPTRRAVPETALPFEASLGTILFGPDRALAIVDGRIVGIGDEVRGARVLEITSNAVMLRDAQGKLRRLSLSTSR